jgi:hypothetical protein
VVQLLFDEHAKVRDAAIEGLSAMACGSGERTLHPSIGNSLFRSIRSTAPSLNMLQGLVGVMERLLRWVDQVEVVHDLVAHVLAQVYRVMFMLPSGDLALHGKILSLLAICLKENICSVEGNSGSLLLIYLSSAWISHLALLRALVVQAKQGTSIVSWKSLPSLYSKFHESLQSSFSSWSRVLPVQESYLITFTSALTECSAALFSWYPAKIPNSLSLWNQVPWDQYLAVVVHICPAEAAMAVTIMLTDTPLPSRRSSFTIPHNTTLSVLDPYEKFIEVGMREFSQRLLPIHTRAPYQRLSRIISDPNINPSAERRRSSSVSALRRLSSIGRLSISSTTSTDTPNQMETLKASVNTTLLDILPLFHQVFLSSSTHNVLSAFMRLFNTIESDSVFPACQPAVSSFHSRYGAQHTSNIYRFALSVLETKNVFYIYLSRRDQEYHVLVGDDEKRGGDDVGFAMELVQWMARKALRRDQLEYLNLPKFIRMICRSILGSNAGTSGTLSIASSDPSSPLIQAGYLNSAGVEQARVDALGCAMRELCKFIFQAIGSPCDDAGFEILKPVVAVGISTVQYPATWKWLAEILG